jgi:hypothetical protein
VRDISHDVTLSGLTLDEIVQRADALTLLRSK